MLSELNRIYQDESAALEQWMSEMLVKPADLVLFPTTERPEQLLPLSSAAIFQADSKVLANGPEHLRPSEQSKSLPSIAAPPLTSAAFSAPPEQRFPRCSYAITPSSLTSAESGTHNASRSSKLLPSPSQEPPIQQGRLTPARSSTCRQAQLSEYNCETCNRMYPKLHLLK